ncbi:MAG TPA: Gfo/Idh/MocA family oxidoreductase [Ramlibacter sp.]|nr:Gfo/Idh/MocA family oxidoreductase [Ramlibacter sp.]
MDQGVLALVGGGRWARVYLSTLAAMPLPGQLAIVARHAPPGVAGMLDAAGRPVLLHADVDGLLASGRPVIGAVVVNAAPAHAGTALRLLQSGIPVLVEKPGATDAAAGDELVEAARAQGVALVPALTYRHCAFLENFAQVLRARGRPPSRLRLEWADPAAETRYGEVKKYDRGIGLALDVVPHVWAIVASVLGEHAPHLEACRVERGGLRLLLRLRAGPTEYEVLLERDAPRRRRFLCADEAAAIDFSEEPGTIAVDGQSRCADPDWATRVDRPVRRQLDAFLHAIGHRPSDGALGDFRASVHLAAECDALVKAQQEALLAAAATSCFDGDTACAVHELLSRRLLASGRLAAGDRAGLDAQVAALREALARAPGSSWLEALARFVPGGTDAHDTISPLPRVPWPGPAPLP